LRKAGFWNPAGILLKAGLGVTPKALAARQEDATSR